MTVTGYSKEQEKPERLIPIPKIPGDYAWGECIEDEEVELWSECYNIKKKELLGLYSVENLPSNK